MAKGDTVDRVFIEFGANTQKLVDGIDQMIKKSNELDTTLNANARKYVGYVDRMLNPTEQLEKRINAVGSTGSYSATQLAAAFGPQLQKAVDQCNRLGIAVTPLTADLYKLSQQMQGSKVSLEALGQGLQNFASNPIQAVKTGLADLFAAIGPVGTGILAIGTAAITAAVGIGKFIENLSDSAVQLRNQAISAGMTTQEYQALKRVGIETGVGLESLPRMLGMLNRELGTGAKMDFVKVLNALRLAAGESAADLSHGVIPIIDDLGKRIAALGTESERAQVLNAAYNRRLQELGVLSVVTKGHVQDYIDTIIKEQAVYSPEQQQRLEQAKARISEMGRAWEAAKISMLDYFAQATVGWKGATWMGIPAIAKPKPVWGADVTDRPKPAAEPSAVSATQALAEAKRGEEIAKLYKDGMQELKAVMDATAAASDQFWEAFKQGSDAEASWWSRRMMDLESQGKRVMPLYLQLADAQDAWNKAEAQGLSVGRTSALQSAGLRIAAIKAELSEIGKYPKYLDDYDKAMKEIAKTQDDIAVKGHAALVPSGAQIEKDTKRITDEAIRAFQELGSIERNLTRDVTQGKLQELRLEQEITANIVPRNEYERYQVELRKAGLEFDVREEEILVKYAQRRFEIETRINALSKMPILGPTLARQSEWMLPALNAQMEEELNQVIRVRAAAITRIHAEEYRQMIETYKQYAGSLFDAIFASGKKGFEAILDWLKNTFAGLLRAVFENVIANALQNSGIYQAIRKTLAQTYPAGGPSTGMDLFGSMTQAVEKGTSSALQQAMAPSYAWSPAAEEWQPENYVMAGGGGYTGLGAGTLAIPGLYQLGGGTAAVGGGGGNWLANLFGGSASMASSVALGVPAASMMAAFSKNPYVKGLGITGLGITGATAAGTLMVGGGMSTFTTAMMANLFNPITAGIAAAVIAGIAIAKAAQGQSTEHAGSLELMRDLGIGVGKDTVSNFIGKFMDVSQAWGIRKDILSSPQFLVEVGGKAAKQQGEATYQKFLKDLEQVKTSWGTFNFREAFEIGDLTGDWTALDKAFTDAFEHSTELQKVLPNWKDVLLVTGDAAKKTAQEFEGLWTTFQTTGEMTQDFVDFLDQTTASLDAAAKMSGAFADQLDQARASAAKFTEMKPMIEGFQALKDGLPGAISETKTIYQTFLDTGEILPELSDKILKFGGDIEAFTKLADIAKVNIQFEKLVQEFKDTGVVTEELRQIVKDFGGDLAVLDKAAELPGLVEGMQGIKDLASGIANLQKTPIEKALAGEWGPEMWGGLSGMGLEPGKLTGMIDLTRFEKGWDQAINDLHSKMKFVWDEAQKKYLQVPAGLEKGGLLEQALWKFGGPAGTQAIQNYAGGFNTITEDLLAKTKAAMDEAYRTEIKNTLDYLGQAQEDLQGKIDDMSGSVTEQLDIVGSNIGKAVDSAKVAVTTELDKILTAINQLVANAGLVPAAVPIPVPASVPLLPTPETPEIPIKYPTSVIPAAETGALVRVHDQEAILNREQTANLLQRNDEPSMLVYIDQRGATINSDVDMQRSVEKALAGLRARGLNIAFAR